jgi:hypothetical protein
MEPDAPMFRNFRNLRRDKVASFEILEPICQVTVRSNKPEKISFRLPPMRRLNLLVSNKRLYNPHNLKCRSAVTSVKWVRVTTAWGVLGLRMEERHPVMEGSCEYIEEAVADSQKRVVLQLGGWARC